MAVNKQSLEVVVHQFDDTDGSDAKKKRRVEVLAEDEFVDRMDAIIERDFYPDLPQMRQQLLAIDSRHVAVDSGGQRFVVERPPTRTQSPTTFETPVRAVESAHGGQHPVANNEDIVGSETVLDSEEPVDNKQLSLDRFLNRFTSEDNESFAQIQDHEKRKHREKYPWLYVDVNKHNESVNKLLELPSIERQAIESGGTSVVTWTYKNQNPVMYNPSAVALTDSEKSLAMDDTKRPSVVHSNTRFDKLPFNERVNQRTIAMAAQLNHRLKEGKIGIDGKELVASDTPQINGHKFVASTPTPAHHLLSESPLMTWGEIEGTPFRLTGSETPVHPGLTPGGSHFKIPDLAHREKLGLSLAARSAQPNREKKKSAIEKVQSSLRLSSPALYLTKTPLERLNSMSPAAQKLATSKLGVNRNADHSLMASYSPARSRVRTPVRTDGANSSRSSTPFDSPLTPKFGLNEKVIQKDVNSRINQLSNKHNRHKAKDFF